MALNSLSFYPATTKTNFCLNQSTFHRWQGLFEQRRNDGKYNSGNQRLYPTGRDPYLTLEIPSDEIEARQCEEWNKSEGDGADCPTCKTDCFTQFRMALRLHVNASMNIR